MEQKLQPGVDRPRGRQYVIAIIVIVALGAVAYFYKRAAMS